MKLAEHRRRGHKDKSLLFVSSTAFVILAGVFAAIAGQIVYNGLPALSWDFVVSSPINSGRGGGIAPMIVATAAIIGVCVAIVVPFGLATAIFMSELDRSRPGTASMLRRCVDVLAAVPSIVFGLFGNLFFCVILGMGFSILSGGLTLACMALPLFVRVAEAGLRGVPNSQRHAAHALGLTQTAAITQILLPQALPTLLAGLALAIGRATAETAALIFTSGYVDRMPESLLDSGRALSVHIFDLAMNVPGGNDNAYASALLLLLIIVIINSASAATLARLIGKQKVAR